MAGSVIAAVATAAGDLENRGSIADGAVMNTADYWRMRRQGKDEAGFWIDPTQPLGRNLSLFGIRMRHTPNLASDTLVVGEFSSTEVCRRVTLDGPGRAARIATRGSPIHTRGGEPR